LLIDNDEPADKSIDLLIEKMSGETASLEDVFDSRAYLESFKDINDYIMAGNAFDKQKMLGFARSLKDSPRAQEMIMKDFII